MSRCFSIIIVARFTALSVSAVNQLEDLAAAKVTIDALLQVSERVAKFIHGVQSSGGCKGPTEKSSISPFAPKAATQNVEWDEDVEMQQDANAPQLSSPVLLQLNNIKAATHQLTARSTSYPFQPVTEKSTYPFSYLRILHLKISIFLFS